MYIELAFAIHHFPSLHEFRFHCNQTTYVSQSITFKRGRGTKKADREGIAKGVDREGGLKEWTEGGAAEGVDRGKILKEWTEEGQIKEWQRSRTKRVGGVIVYLLTIVCTQKF